MLELLAKDQFIYALANGDMHLRTQQRILREALQTALELEAFELADQQRTKPVRRTAIEETADETLVTVKDVKPASCYLKQYFQECLDNCLLRNGSQQQRRQRRPLESVLRRRFIKGNCWSCGKPDHM